MNCCGIIVPRMKDIIGERSDNYLPECIRKRYHLGPHVFLTPEGKYISWEDDYECGCCEPEDTDRCYVYRDITKEDFLVLERSCANT